MKSSGRLIASILVLVALAVAGFGWLSAASAAPKASDKAAEKRDKAVKEFVAKFYDALARHDFDAVVELCDVPFLIQPNGIRKDKASIKKQYEDGHKLFPTHGEIKQVVKSIETYKDAKRRFLPEQVKDADHVLTDNDLVVHVVVNREAGKFHHRLLIKLVDGKPRLVGTQVETDDE
jgi:hypothetical protein